MIVFTASGLCQCEGGFILCPHKERRNTNLVAKSSEIASVYKNITEVATDKRRMRGIT